MSRGVEDTVRGTALTDRQRDVLDIIRRHVRARGVPPSRSELAKELGVGRQSTVDQQLSALAKKGWVRLLPGVERGIQLLREGAPLLDADQLPEVTAGNPIVADEQAARPRLHDFESFVSEFSGRPDFFLRVEGDSMQRAGFRSGDVVGVEREREPCEGEVVVARIGDAITLKRFHRASADAIELQPESANPEHEPIRIGPADDFQIVGVVVGAIVGAKGRDDCCSG